MKKTIILFCFIFCISCSQRKADSTPVTTEQQAEQQKEADSPFNPALRKAIDEFIDVVENKCVGVKWGESEWDDESFERIKWEEVKVYWLHSTMIKESLCSL